MIQHWFKHDTTVRECGFEALRQWGFGDIEEDFGMMNTAVLGDVDMKWQLNRGSGGQRHLQQWGQLYTVTIIQLDHASGDTDDEGWGSGTTEAKNSGGQLASSFF